MPKIIVEMPVVSRKQTKKGKWSEKRMKIPTVNHMYIFNRKTGARFMTKQAKEFKSLLASTWTQKELTRFSSGTRLTLLLNVFFEHKTRRDLDNVFKSVQDALNKVAYEDDYDVADIIAHRYHDKERPRLEIELYPTTVDLTE